MESLLQAFKELKEVLSNNQELNIHYRKIVNFLTYGDNYNIPILFYGTSSKILPFVKRQLGKDFPFLIKETILSRIDYVTMVSNPSITNPKLIVKFNEKDSYKEEERDLLVKFFSYYGNYDRSFIENYIDRSNSLFPITINSVHELEADASIIEKLSVMGCIKNITLLFPTIDKNHSRRLTFIFIDEDKKWPDDLDCLDYQFHILNTVNDFTGKLFFENLNKTCVTLSEILNIDQYLISQVLINTVFFSTIDREKISKDSRILSGYKIDFFPTEFKSLESKYNLINLVWISSLFLNISELNLFLKEYGEVIFESLGTKSFINLCNIACNKFKSLSNEIKSLKTLKEENKQIFELFNKLKEISRKIKTLKNQHKSDENIIGNLILLLNEIVKAKEFINNSESMVKIEDIKQQLEQEYSNRKGKDFLSYLLKFREFKSIDDIINEVGVLLEDIIQDFLSEQKITNLNSEFLKIILDELPIISDEVSKRILLIIKKYLSTKAETVNSEESKKEDTTETSKSINNKQPLHSN